MRPAARAGQVKSNRRTGLRILTPARIERQVAPGWLSGRYLARQRGYPRNRLGRPAATTATRAPACGQFAATHPARFLAQLALPREVARAYAAGARGSTRRPGRPRAPQPLVPPGPGAGSPRRGRAPKHTEFSHDLTRAGPPPVALQALRLRDREDVPPLGRAVRPLPQDARWLAAPRGHGCRRSRAVPDPTGRQVGRQCLDAEPGVQRAALPLPARARTRATKLG